MDGYVDTPRLLQNQYAHGANLNARSRLHERFSTNPQRWRQWLFDRIEAPEPGDVLEVGCGTAELWTTNLGRAPAGWRVVLTDLSPGMLAEARRALGSGGRRFELQVADASRLPFGDGRFDAVVASHMLYHVPNLDQALAEIRRVLKPSGRLYAATNGSDHMRELRELAAQAAPELPFAGDGPTAFTLENGEAQLRRRFASVSLDLYPDALEVAEPEPLVAYILSTLEAQAVLTDSHARELHRLAAERIAARGAFHVTKSTGLFTATP